MGRKIIRNETVKKKKKRMSDNTKMLIEVLALVVLTIAIVLMALGYSGFFDHNTSESTEDVPLTQYQPTEHRDAHDVELPEGMETIKKMYLVLNHPSSDITVERTSKYFVDSVDRLHMNGPYIEQLAGETFVEEIQVKDKEYKLKFNSKATEQDTLKIVPEFPQMPNVTCGLAIGDRGMNMTMYSAEWIEVSLDHFMVRAKGMRQEIIYTYYDNTEHPSYVKITFFPSMEGDVEVRFDGNEYTVYASNKILSITVETLGYDKENLEKVVSASLNCMSMTECSFKINKSGSAIMTSENPMYQLPTMPNIGG